MRGSYKMSGVHVIFYLLLHSIYGGDPTDECFAKSSSCKVDDSVYPPYNTFTNQFDANGCKKACLEQNGNGILIKEGDYLTKRYCQLAISRPGLCKLYYQQNIDVGGAIRKREVFGPVRMNLDRQYQRQTTPDYLAFNSIHGIRYRNRGNAFQLTNIDELMANDNCFMLKPNCPGFQQPYTKQIEMTTATKATTTVPTTTTSFLTQEQLRTVTQWKLSPSTIPTKQLDTTKCFNNVRKNRGVQGSTIKFFYGAAEFDETLESCQRKCLQEDICQSLNYFGKDSDNSAICVIHNSICLEETNCVDTNDEQTGILDPTEYWERIPECKP